MAAHPSSLLARIKGSGTTEHTRGALKTEPTRGPGALGEREPRGPCGLGGTCVRGDTEVDELPIVEVVVLDQGRHSASTTGVWWT